MHEIELNKNIFSERLDALFIQLNELSIYVSEHLNEIEFELIFSNRLDKEMQLIHHQSLHEKFENFENLIWYLIQCCHQNWIIKNNLSSDSSILHEGVCTARFNGPGTTSRGTVDASI
jgi:hypothetical protein